MSQENAWFSGLVEALRQRIRNRLSAALLAPSMVIVLTFIWQLGEHAGERSLDTTLTPSKRGAAENIFFGTAGRLVGSGSRVSARSGAGRTETAPKDPDRSRSRALGRRGAFRVV